MSKSSGFLIPHVVKKYWMAATGLFLCLFLIGHLFGNLQLLSTGYESSLKFNEYTIFMTTNPLIMVLSYLTYLSIIIHAVDGLLLTIQNQKARPQKYAYSKPEKNSAWSSRNMGILGTIILVYIVVHLQNFWYQLKFGSLPYMMTEDGSSPLTTEGEIIRGGTLDGSSIMLNGELAGNAMKDLHTIVLSSFENPVLVAFYVLSMVALGFHLWHGFKSAFQSFGLRHPKYYPFIRKFGYAFAVIVPAAFAIIPIVIFFKAGN